MADTIKIYTAEDMRTFRDRVNGGESDLNAILMNDIDILEYDSDGDKRSWEPIGTYFDKFQGLFDGQGHTIKGLYIDIGDVITARLFKHRGVVEVDDVNYGLFRNVYNGSVKNLTVEGLIEGRSHMGKDLSCKCDSAHIAGIAANVCRSEIVNCVSKVNVNVRNPAFCIGGICGAMVSPLGYITQPPLSKIRNCVNYGTLIGHKPHGILGRTIWKNSRGPIQNCRNEGTICIRGIDNIGSILQNNYRYDQIGCGFNAADSNQQNGKVLLPFQNSLPGLCCLTYDFSVQATPSSKLDKYDVLEGFAQILAKDKHHEHINKHGDNYLHLLCQNESVIKNTINNLHMNGNDKEATLPDIISLLIRYTNIDFGAKNNLGEEAIDILKTNEHGKELAETIAMIKEIKKEQTESENDYDDSFSDIGW